MTLTPGRLWAVYVAAGIVLAAGVVAGVLRHHHDTRPPPSSAPSAVHVQVKTPVAPSPVYPQVQAPSDDQRPIGCSSLTAVDADNVSRQFVIAVGNAYTATPQARQCQAALVVAHSDIKNQDYTMACAPESSQIKCTGGQSAVIVFRPGT